MIKLSISNRAISSKQNCHYQRNEDIAPLNLNLVKDGREWSASCSGRFIPEKNRVTFEYEMWNFNKLAMGVYMAMFNHHLFNFIIMILPPAFKGKSLRLSHHY